MPLISVIVPVYKAELYLERCLDSILNQTFTDFELILVDDGSPDRCGAICDEYAAKDTRIFVIHQPNAGQAAAKNVGLDRIEAVGSSQWIVFIDSDDWVHPAYLETLYKAAKENRTEIAVCDLITTEGEPPVLPDNAVPVRCLTPEELWVKNRLTATIPVCKICSVAVFRGFRFPVGRVHEDEFLLYRVLFSCPEIAYADVPLYYYYQNPDGISLQKKWTPGKADSVVAFSEQCAFFRAGKYRKAELISARALLCASVESLSNLTVNYPEEQKLIRECRTALRKTMRTYGKQPELAGACSSATYERLAHPVKTNLRRKKKNLRIFIRRLFHA